MIDSDKLHLANMALQQAVASERDRTAHGHGQSDPETIVKTAEKYTAFLEAHSGA